METIIKKAVMIFFENYHFKIEKQLVIGTINEKKAIKAVKEYINTKCDVKNTYILKNVKLNEIDFDLCYAITI